MTQDSNAHNTQRFCNFCQCMHHHKEFASEYNISSDDVAFNTVATDWKDSENPHDARLLICDASFLVVNHRYNNKINQINVKHFEKKDVELPTFRKICSYISSILMILLIVLIFFCLAAVPIWLIESKMTPNVEEATWRNITSPSAILNHQSQWTYGSSIYYMVVTQTTIGYGDRVPLTIQGRFYLQAISMIGLSLVGTLIAMMTKLVFKNARMLSLFIAIRAKKCTTMLLNCCRDAHHTQIYTHPIKYRSDLMRILTPLEKKIFVFFSSHAMHIFLVFSSVWIYILVGAAVIKGVEGWDYYTSEWFCFVTLTTIGYGDVTPVTQLGRGIASVYAVLGFGMLAILFGLIGSACVEFGRGGVKSLFTHHEHSNNNKETQRLINDETI